MEQLIPSWLGYDFPEVPFVFIGDCGSSDNHYSFDFGFVGGGHTHLCEKDPLYRCICISDRKFVFDELMWHEYAHALTKKEGVTILRCLNNGLHDIKFTSDEVKNTWDTGHPPEWRQLIESFGYPARKEIPLSEIPNVTW